jgi:2-polyprenyl-6-methoxyphenol hydroxylase-like FAD-dependent oxidoreductase
MEEDLEQAGAVRFRIASDVRVERPGYDPFPPRDLGWFGYSLSRPMIEFTVRRRVEQHANITLRQRCRAREIVVTPGGTAVAGVRFDSADGTVETLSADLVVDATGRGTLALALLRSLGRPPPEETSIGVDVGYSTAVFAVPDDAPGDWKGVITLPEVPRSSRGGLLFPRREIAGS